MPYSPYCLEDDFSEVRLITFNTKITHLGDALPCSKEVGWTSS
jgi:hypothetical protein